MEVVSVSIPHELKEKIKEQQKTDPRFGWTAIFQYGYKKLLMDDGKTEDLNIKVEKLATKLNFYAQKSFMLEEELTKLKAARGV